MQIELKQDAEVEPASPEFDLVSLNHPLSKYTVEQKIQCVTLYATTGRIKDIHKATGVPSGTINQWKNKAAWWDEALAEVRLTKNEELDALLTYGLHKASEEMVDRLENGNEALVNGEVVRVKVPARELAQAVNCLYEKRALIRGTATSVTEKKVDFSDLALQFKEFSKELQKSDERVVN